VDNPPLAAGMDEMFDRSDCVQFGSANILTGTARPARINFACLVKKPFAMMKLIPHASI
jgi:hypothetical protein